jgi:putative serine protease PepD
MLDLGVAVVAAVIGIAVVLVIHPAAVDRALSGFDSARPRTNDELTTYWVEQLAEKVLPSVVTLESSEGGHSLMGSGIILSADGLIMTNNHVVAAVGTRPHAPTPIKVNFNGGRTAAVRVISTDAQSDIAIVKGEHVSGLTPISVGSSAKLRVGQPVAAVGSPLDLRGTVTVGIVSAVNRLVCPATDPGHPVGAFYAIQTDAAINPGNSGGALVDINGRLVWDERGGVGCAQRRRLHQQPAWVDRPWFRHSD